MVNIDLSEANAPAGQEIRLDEAVLKFTSVPHTGCSKFAKRYGDEAIAFIRAPKSPSMRLRGAHVKVIQEGLV